MTIEEKKAIFKKQLIEYCNEKVGIDRVGKYEYGRGHKKVDFKKDNSTFQRFYRRKYPFIWGKSEEADFQYKLYSEDVMIEIINYYDRKNKIKEYFTKIKELRAENTLFIEKYKK